LNRRHVFDANQRERFFGQTARKLQSFYEAAETTETKNQRQSLRDVERLQKSKHGATSCGIFVPGNRTNPQRALGEKPGREDY
tara:strand:+ start:440 stop:688 length:249 start_codon:yes stop_codon:yes gene_type:complete